MTVLMNHEFISFLSFFPFPYSLEEEKTNHHYWKMSLCSSQWSDLNHKQLSIERKIDPYHWLLEKPFFFLWCSLKVNEEETKWAKKNPIKVWYDMRANVTMHDVKMNEEERPRWDIFFIKIRFSCESVNCFTKSFQLRNRKRHTYGESYLRCSFFFFLEERKLIFLKRIFERARLINLRP